MVSSRYIRCCKNGDKKYLHCDEVKVCFLLKSTFVKECHAKNIWGKVKATESLALFVDEKQVKTPDHDWLFNLINTIERSWISKIIEAVDSVRVKSENESRE